MHFLPFFELKSDSLRTISMKKKLKMADSKKRIMFQLCQFSMFLREIFMDWSLGYQNGLMGRVLIWLNLHGNEAV